MTSHEELVNEMATLERMSVQERLKLARKRRAQQLKRYATSEKEFLKKSRKSAFGRSVGTSPPTEHVRTRLINFAHNIQLLEAAARGDIEEVGSLLESGVDPNVGNEDGLTALHQCCIDNNETMMRLLVDNNADVNVTDRELWTPLHASSTCGHVSLARFLVANGAELLAINSDGNMPYDICEDEVTLDFIESQMAERGITQEHIDELRDVVPNHMLEDLQVLKDSDGELELRNEVGASYLHIAAACGYDRVAKFLLDCNVDVSARDLDGWQPIHAAACWAHGDMIQLLVRYGADLDAKTNNQETPLTICEDEELKNLMNQLKAEMYAHRSLDNNLVRRNSSRNKRSASIRRSSKREKGEMRKLDAKGEAMFIRTQSSTEEEPPVTNIDDVVTDPSGEHHSIGQEGGDSNPKDTTNGAAETDVIPMPVISEETPTNGHVTRDENGASTMQNGDSAKRSGFTREPKSILKKQRVQEDAVAEDTIQRKSKKEKQRELELRKQEADLEKQLAKEERERVKQLEREERQREREEREQEKQRLKEEKKLQQRLEKEEREREKQLRRKTIAEDTPEAVANDGRQEPDANHSSCDTLAELKRHRASEHSKRTLSGDSTEEFETAWLDSGRKDSYDILKDHQSQNSIRKKSPHIARKLFPHRPASGSYSFSEVSAESRESSTAEQNGGTDQTGLKDSEKVFIPDPPLKRFTATKPEVIGGDEDVRGCCTIL